MPDITMEIRRIPKPGKDYEVIQLATNAMKKLGRRGIVTASVMIPHTSQADVVSAIPFSSWDEIENLHDNYFSNEEFRNNQAKIAELCVQAPTIQALNVIAKGDFSGSIKYMRRNFILAKRGQSADVQKTLLEWREEFPEGKKPTIQRGVAGSLDLVRVSVPYENLNTLIEASFDVATNPSYEKFREKITKNTERLIGYNSRIVHRN